MYSTGTHHLFWSWIWITSEIAVLKSNGPNSNGDRLNWTRVIGIQWSLQSCDSVIIQVSSLHAVKPLMQPSLAVSISCSGLHGASHDTRCGITLLQCKNRITVVCVQCIFILPHPMYLRTYSICMLRWLLSFTTEKNYSNARQHFLHSDRLEDFGVMLLEYAMKEGYPHERELFLAQAVLQ